MNDRVLEIISEQSGIEILKLFPNTRLEQDLGITGDDMWEIIELLSKEFKIDLGEVDFSYYFYAEATGFFWGLLNKDKVRSIESYPITVGHLKNVSMLGKWTRPEQVK